VRSGTLGSRAVRRGGVGAVCLLAVLATALTWPASREARPPSTRVLSVAVKPPTRAEVVGSGFVVRPGRVVTVAHLLERRLRIVVRSPGGPARRAQLLRVDRRGDLALLAVPGLPGSSLRTAEAGEDVRLMLLRGGQSMTRHARVRRAIEAHVRAAPGARPHTRPALELAARIAAGDSGAPVVTAGGGVAGVLFARSREDAHTAYAVDAKEVEALVKRRGRRRPRNGPVISKIAPGPGSRSLFAEARCEEKYMREPDRGEAVVDNLDPLAPDVVGVHAVVGGRAHVDGVAVEPDALAALEARPAPHLAPSGGVACERIGHLDGSPAPDASDLEQTSG
jgi:S1-C subfamily serine protease